MDIPELRDALAAHFREKDFDTGDAGPLNLDLLFESKVERWGFVLCPDREEGMAYLGAFEAAMQRVLDARQNDALQKDSALKLGLGIAFASTAEGQSPSYRRALKKYSNSIVFEDLGLSLFLVTGEEAVDVLSPNEVNPFLRNLNRWIEERGS